MRGVWIMRKKVGCGVGRACFDVPVPCPACRTVLDMILEFGIDFFSVKHPS